jgi:hypothetical protein
MLIAIYLSLPKCQGRFQFRNNSTWWLHLLPLWHGITQSGYTFIDSQGCWWLLENCDCLHELVAERGLEKQPWTIGRIFAAQINCKTSWMQKITCERPGRNLIIVNIQMRFHNITHSIVKKCHYSIFQTSTSQRWTSMKYRTCTKLTETVVKKIEVQCNWQQPKTGILLSFWYVFESSNFIVFQKN